MPRCVPVFLGGILIGSYTEEGSLGIDSRAAIAALRHILPEKTPTATTDTSAGTFSINVTDHTANEQEAAVQSIRIAAKLDIEVKTHYSESAQR